MWKSTACPWFREVRNQRESCYRTASSARISSLEVACRIGKRRTKPRKASRGDYSEIFWGHHEGRPVAVKIPLVKDRGLEVSDNTAQMTQEVERELEVTRKCRHQHVMQAPARHAGDRAHGR